VKRPLALSLVVVALALVVVALVGPVRRGIEQRDREAATRKLAEQVIAERAEAKARFDVDRAAIIADLRKRVESGDHQGAMRVAAPYVHVGDAELMELYRDAAGSESRRQRADAYRSLVASACNEQNVREHVGAMLALGGTPQPAPSSVVRLSGVEARAVVRARTSEPPPAETAGAPAAATPSDWLSLAREQNRARILPDFLGFLYAPEAESMICVWRVEGERRDGAATMRYTMDAWLAPTPDGQRLVADPVGYRERATNK
jgi:hypothetical protein